MQTLHRIVVFRLRWDPPTQAYMRRRLAEGKSKSEIMRCLKRYVAREIFGMIRPPAAIQQVTADEAIRAA
jgi:hypothetical protein